MTKPEYRSLDYADNVRHLKARGYLYLTFYVNREILCEDLESEPGYEDVLFREAIPSLKPVADEDANIICLPIDSAETVIVLDSDAVSYQVNAKYF